MNTPEEINYGLNLLLSLSYTYDKSRNKSVVDLDDIIRLINLQRVALDEQGFKNVLGKLVKR